MSNYSKHEGIPMQILLDALFADCRRLIELIGKVDNTQAITAVHKCYSEKLGFLKRTHNCSIGVLHEFIIYNKLRFESRQP